MTLERSDQRSEQPKVKGVRDRAQVVRRMMVEEWFTCWDSGAEMLGGWGGQSSKVVLGGGIPGDSGKR